MLQNIKRMCYRPSEVNDRCHWKSNVDDVLVNDTERRALMKPTLGH